MPKQNLTLIVMAAGFGKRLQPFTLTIPKPMISILNKPIMEYTLENASRYVNEIVIVVCYKKELISGYFGNSFKGIPIKYVEQTEPLGTAHALHTAIPFVSNEQFVLLNGDDLYDKSLFAFLDEPVQFVIGKKEEAWHKFGVIKKDNKKLRDIVEKPTEYISDLINIGFYRFSRSIDQYFERIKPSIRGEYEINDLIRLHLQKELIEVKEITEGWDPIGYPWDILSITEKLLCMQKSDIKGIVEPNVTILGKLVLPKSSIIKSGTRIEGNFYVGENCLIGPNAYLKGFGSIGSGSEIGNAVEFTRSVVGTSTNIKHLSYIGDSVIGNNANIAAGTMTANLKHSHHPVKAMINGILVDSNKSKLGSFIADNVKTGIHTSIYPGVSLAPEQTTLPGEVVKENK